MTVVSAIENGWDWDNVAAQVNFYYRGTLVGDFTATRVEIVLAASVGTTLTVGTGLTVDDDALGAHTVITTGDERITAGNLRLGGVNTFANTQPTSAAVMKQGTAPVGAITTSGGVFSSATAVQKVIADGTVSNIQT